jgi:2',3'-cyclic-nucleotide 2'-phosphodiesterase/3'-nucleotidase
MMMLMTKQLFWRTRSLGLLIAILVLFGVASACVVPVAETHDDIVLIHTNDIHGNVRPLPATWLRRDPPPLVGGAGAFATFVDEWRRLRGGREGVLLLDAGDIYQGTPEGNESRGRLMIDLFNRFEYDAITLGNHEFDHGLDNLSELIKAADFPVLAANLRDAKTGRLPDGVLPSIEVRRSGVRIGIIGLLTEDLAKVAAVDVENGWHPLGEIETARAEAERLRRAGVDLVFLLSHCGLDRDSVIALNLGKRGPPGSPARERPLIDLIIGGHTHSRLAQPLVVNEVPIVQTGGRGTAAGILRFSYDRTRRRMKVISYRMEDLFLDRYPENPETVEFLRPWFEDIDRRMNRIVGFAPQAITRSSEYARGAEQGSSPLGNLQTDLMRRITGAEIAFQNRGGIRADIPAGQVRLRDLYVVSPFGNTLVTMELTGRHIRRIVEGGLSGGRSGLEFSGIVVHYDPALPAWRQVTKILVDGAPLVDDRWYKVATNNFLGGGGDAYPEFGEGRNVVDSNRPFLDHEVANFEANPSGVTAPRENRWVKTGR